MKILILGFTKIKYMPYLNLYLEILLNKNHKVDVVCWNRDGKEDLNINSKINIHTFDYLMEDEIVKTKKIKAFGEYRKFVKRILAEKKFDKVIVLHTLPGLLVLDILLKKFKKKYILDYRDTTFENVYIYKKIIGIMSKNSYITIVSSAAFKKYLPSKSNIHITHNIDKEAIGNKKEEKEKKEMYPIKIGFWGFIRHRNINLKMVEELANDKRFELHYYGREQETAKKIKEYCNKNKINNVFFHGEYKPSDRKEIASLTDIIHNIYENNFSMKNAMANKYYDGLLFEIPQICNYGSFMGECVTKNKVGIEINLYKKGFKEDIIKYYNNLDCVEFSNACTKTLSNVLREYDESVERIKEFLDI